MLPSRHDVICINDTWDKLNTQDEGKHQVHKGGYQGKCATICRLCHIFCGGQKPQHVRCSQNQSTLPRLTFEEREWSTLILTKYIFIHVRQNIWLQTPQHKKRKIARNKRGQLWLNLIFGLILKWWQESWNWTNFIALLFCWVDLTSVWRNTMKRSLPHYDCFFLFLFYR